MKEIMKSISLATKRANFDNVLQLALAQELGLEIQTFAFPPVVGGNGWNEILAEYKSKLQGFPNPLSLHGAFMDMAPGSPDPAFSKVTLERTHQFLDLAQELKADTVVFHANFIATIRDEEYRDGWTDRMIYFFNPVAEYAQSIGVNIVLENMWEFDPSIIRYVLEGVDNPSFTACLDVGHAHLFSHIPFDDWVSDLNAWVTYIHMNNNYGDLDHHLGLDEGVLNYHQIMPRLAHLPSNPRIIFEMESVKDMKRSLSYLHLLKTSTE